MTLAAASEHQLKLWLEALLPGHLLAPLLLHLSSGHRSPVQDSPPSPLSPAPPSAPRPSLASSPSRERFFARSKSFVKARATPRTASASPGQGTRVRPVIVPNLKKAQLTDKYAAKYKFSGDELIRKDAVEILSPGAGLGLPVTAPLAQLEIDGSGRLEYLRTCALLDVRPNILVLQGLAGARLVLKDYPLTRRCNAKAARAGASCAEEMYPEAQAMVRALAVNTVTKDVHVSAPLSAQGGKPLVEAIAHANTAHFLALGLKAISVSAASCLSGFLAQQGCSLRQLDLSSTQLGDKGLAALCDGLQRNSSLTALLLRKCQVAASPYQHQRHSNAARASLRITASTRMSLLAASS